MALIKCPECSAEISDSAVACVKCGFPINKLAGQATAIPVTPTARQESSSNRTLLIILIVLLSLIVLVPVSCVVIGLTSLAVPRFTNAQDRARFAEAPRVIASFESAALAAMAEAENPARITERNLIFDLSDVNDSKSWTYEIFVRNGTIKITATPKIPFGGKILPGPALTSAYDAKGNCFVRTIEPEVAAMTTVFSDSGCK